MWSKGRELKLACLVQRQVFTRQQVTVRGKSFHLLLKLVF